MKLCFPVNYVKITNPFSDDHKGIDLAWYKTPNTPVLSCFNGIVSKIYTDEKYGGGLTLTIKYDNGYSSDFKHLSKILVKVGDKVSQMQEVAIMGNTGWNSTGVHLHFNLYKNEKRVNPLDYCYLYNNQKVSEEDKNKIKYYKGDENMKFKIGDKVIINGNLYSSSNAKNVSGKVENKVTEITRVAKDTLHPYNTTGDLGWMDEYDISFFEKDDYKSLYEEELTKNKNLQNQLDLANKKITDAINILE